MNAIHRLPTTPPVDECAEITFHREVAPDHHLVRFAASSIARNAEPGQFLQIRVSDEFTPFLRRPMSIADADPDAGTVDVLYRAGGGGTTRLTHRRPGECLPILGPLGHPFELPSDSETRVVLVGGGVGMPPLHFAARRLGADRVMVIQGAQTSSLVLYRDEFREMGVQTSITTNDGSEGIRGIVTDALVKEFDATNGQLEVLCCGPMPMMEAVAQITLQRDIPCQVSLEERMACGFGICMGCAVDLRGRDDGGFALVCVDGPVFRAGEAFGA